MKKVKMVLYGEPGAGKSVFASKAPNAFFITTDGNYEWLEDFGAKPEDHIQVNSWSEAKDVFKSEKIKSYDTIVIDLLEDMFKWCEQEYCVRNKIEHLSDLGYGKAYDATRNEFFIEMCKVINMEKNIIFIMHGIDVVVKDRRGVESTKHVPSSRIPDKVLDMIEGRVRYFIRCYVKDVELDDGTIVKRRYLSLIPKPNEYGIARGVDETKVPQDIPLEWSEFANVIGLNSVVEKTFEKTEETQLVKKTRKKTERVEVKENNEIDAVLSAQMKIDESSEEVKEEIKESSEEVKEEVKEEVNVNDRVAAIKARLAALKK